MKDQKTLKSFTFQSKLRAFFNEKAAAVAMETVTDQDAAASPFIRLSVNQSLLDVVNASNPCRSLWCQRTSCVFPRNTVQLIRPGIAGTSLPKLVSRSLVTLSHSALMAAKLSQWVCKNELLLNSYQGFQSRVKTKSGPDNLIES